MKVQEQVFKWCKFEWLYSYIEVAFTAGVNAVSMSLLACLLPANEKDSKV